MWTDQAREAAKLAQQGKAQAAHQTGVNRATFGNGAFFLKALLGVAAGASAFVVNGVTRPAAGGKHGR